MGLEKLRPEVIEEGRGHPFVLALMGTLRERRMALLSELEGAASSGGVGGYINALGGRASEVRHTLDTILNTKGLEE